MFVWLLMPCILCGLVCPICFCGLFCPNFSQILKAFTHLPTLAPDGYFVLGFMPHHYWLECHIYWGILFLLYNSFPWNVFILCNFISWNISNFYVWKLPKIIRVQNVNSVISHFTSFPHNKRGKFMLTFYNNFACHAMCWKQQTGRLRRTGHLHFYINCDELNMNYKSKI